MQALPQSEAASVASKTVTDSARQALKILLVDDHHDTCAALEKLLARYGYLVAVSHDVRSAMDAAVRNKFDLLISDIALPDGTRMDLMMELRAIANVPRGLRSAALAITAISNGVCRPASPSISSSPSSWTTSKPLSNGRSARRDACVGINNCVFVSLTPRFSAMLKALPG